MYITCVIRSTPMRQPQCGYYLRRVLFLLITSFLSLTSLGAMNAAENVFKSKISVKGSSKIGFELMPAESMGISFINSLDELKGASNRVLFNGSGVAVGDVDGDGLIDLFFCGLDSKNQLYRNLGDWKFVQMNIPDTLELPGFPTRGATFADVDGDRNLDLLLTTVGGGPRLFTNDGKGVFNEKTNESGLKSRAGGSSLTLADIDGNGTLDLYIANNRAEDIRDLGRVNLKRINGNIVPPDALKNRLLVHKGQIHEFGEADDLYLNDGHGAFKRVAWTDGHFRNSGKPLIAEPLDWGLTATFRDINGDRAPDLYVCNDYWTPDRIWINDGTGHFDELSIDDLNVTSASSMGVDFADVDLDGDLDGFIVDMLSRDPRLRKRQQPAYNPLFKESELSGMRQQVMRNTLLNQRADGSFIDLSFFAGVEASDWSWCPIFMDVDLDGYSDLLISAGYPHDVQDLDAIQLIQTKQHSWERYQDPAALRKAFAKEMMEHYRLYPDLNLPIIAYRNRGDGTFEEVTDSWGTDVLGVHQGFATGDLDGDGDLDLILNSLNASPTLFRNLASKPRIKVRLKGRTPNTQAIGSKLLLKQVEAPTLTAEVLAGGRYLSGGDTEIVFAAGKTHAKRVIEVHWRSGGITRLPDVLANQVYQIEEPSELPPLIVNDSIKTPDSDTLFADKSSLISVPYHEGPVNDYLRQPLLPFQLNRRGPGLAVGDLNQDGWEDLIVGAGRGGKISTLWGNEEGSWELEEGGLQVPDDTAGIFMGHLIGRPNRSFLGFAGYEQSLKEGLVLNDHHSGQWQSFGASLPGIGSFAMGPLNGRGPLALFLAGGVKLGHYPSSHPSVLMTLQSGLPVPDQRNNSLMNVVGMAKGVVWSDLTGDGFPELIIGTEWGPIRVFENRSGSLFDVTESWGFMSYKGLWNGIVTADLDGNGLPDIIAGNWGLNSSWRASLTKPMSLFHGVLANPAVTDLIETEDHPGPELAPARLLSDIGPHLPFIYQTVTNYAGYSKASLEQIMGSRYPLGRMAQATTFASMVFLNQGKGKPFLPLELPKEAQWAPVFGIQAADFNGDGSEDLILCQNDSDSRPGLSAQINGSALVLLGDGNGRFSLLPSSKSGVNLKAGLSSVALADFNRDGSMDFALVSNRRKVGLFLNMSSKPGLRVTIKGPSINPFGIGCQLRLIGESNQWGPLKEIQAGTGWLAQNSPTTILNADFKPIGIWVKWPGGSVTETSLDGEKEILLTWSP